MDGEGQITRPPSKRSLGRIVVISLVAASLALFLFVLPVEYRIDPTGFGRLTGLNELADAQEWVEVPIPGGDNTVARSYPGGFRRDVIDIAIPGEDGDLEYKLSMKAGDSVVYSWKVLEIDNPEWFYSEFHGHTEPEPGTVGEVTFYRRETGASDNGLLVAPFEGIHGWYLQNQTENPVVVRLEIAGFYELIPDQLTQ